MTAAEMLARAESVGVQFHLDAGSLRYRGELPDELFAALWAKRDAVRELVAARCCRACGAAPEGDELGGFGLHGWRCTACMTAAGMPVGRMVNPLDEVLPDDTAPLGKCRDCGFTAHLRDGLCGACIFATLVEGER